MAICSICVIKRFLFNIYCSCWRVYSLQTARLIRNMAGLNSFARFSIWKCKMLRYLLTIFCFELEEWLFSQLVICNFYSWKQIKACSLDAELIFGSNWSIIKLWSSYSSFQALLFIEYFTIFTRFYCLSVKLYERFSAGNRQRWYQYNQIDFNIWHSYKIFDAISLHTSVSLPQTMVIWRWNGC